MAIIELKVKIIGGMGGPNNDSIPAYADKNAPNGAWLYGPDGKQLMVKNSEVSGLEYLVVNPYALSPEENQGSRFMTLKSDGSVNYIRTWIYNPETGHGEDFQPGQQAWLEFSHMENSEEEPPEEPPVEPPMEGDFSIFVIDWDARTVTLKPE